jgi:hypothetical protein
MRDVGVRVWELLIWGAYLCGAIGVSWRLGRMAVSNGHQLEIKFCYE